MSQEAISEAIDVIAFLRSAVLSGESLDQGDNDRVSAAILGLRALATADKPLTGRDGVPGDKVVIPRLVYESLARAAEKALEPTGEHRVMEGGYCPDCQGQCLRTWLTRPPLPPKPSKDRQWDGS